MQQISRRNLGTALAGLIASVSGAIAAKRNPPVSAEGEEAIPIIDPALQARRDRAAENPPAELIQEAADFIREGDEEQFAGELGLARAFWREYRDLVETEELPERFEEDCTYLLDDRCMKPGYSEELKKRAREVASAWIENGIAERNYGFILPA